MISDVPITYDPRLGHEVLEIDGEPAAVVPVSIPP